MKINKIMRLSQNKIDNYVDGDGMQAKGALALLLRLSRWAGVAPLRATDARAGWRFNASPRAAVVQAVFMILQKIVTVTGIIADFSQEPGCRLRIGETFLKEIIWLCEVVLVMLIASLAVYTGPAQMECLKRVLEQLQQVHFDLNLSPSNKSEKNKTYVTALLLLWTVGIMFLDFACYYRKVKDDSTRICILYMYMPFYISSVQAMLTVMRWALTVDAVHSAASALNQRLQELCRETGNYKNPTYLQTPIRCLVLSHERIGNVMRQTSDANGMILMATLAAIFLKLVLIPYYTMSYMYDVEGHIEYGLALSINWSLYLMAILIVLIEPCHMTHSQRARTEVLVQQLIMKINPKHKQLFKELNQYLKQIVLSKTEFKPLGIYSLDRPLLAMMLSSITTYLLIIIQFEKLLQITSKVAP